MQIMCLFTSPLIGCVMDYKIKEVLQAALDKNRRGSRRESSTRRESMTKRPSFSSGDSRRESVTKKPSLTNGESTPVRKESLSKKPSFTIGGDTKGPTIISFGGEDQKPVNGTVNGGLKHNNSLNGDIELGLKMGNGSFVMTKTRHPSSSSTSSNDSLNPKPPMSLKIRKLLNGSYAFFITATLVMFFGVTVLIPNLQIQVSSCSVPSLPHHCSFKRYPSPPHYSLVELILISSVVFSFSLEYYYIDHSSTNDFAMQISEVLSLL